MKMGDCMKKDNKCACVSQSANCNSLFDLSAKEYLSNIRVGINTGRSLDCMTNKSGDTYTVADLNATERKYDFITPTDMTLIQSFKSQGFNAVRVPVTWSEAIGQGPDYVVSDVLMDRVQKVVDMILAQDMYCILNTHNEFNWLYTRQTDLEKMYDKFNALWIQIAERFKDYDGRLIFEGYNEVLKLPEDWTSKAPSDYEVVNNLAQNFVDTVRATGGNNAKRFLIVAPYGAGCRQEEMTNFVLPTDTIEDKLIVDVHYYFPATSLTGSEKFVLDDTVKAQLDDAFELVRALFLDKGYAVMMNETAFSDVGTPLVEREKWAKHVFEKATQMDIPMYWWDNGTMLRLFDRSAPPYTPAYPTIIQEIMNATSPRVK